MPGGAGVAQANIAQQLFDSSKTCHLVSLKLGKKKKKNLESPSVPPQLLDVGAGFRGKPRDIGSSLLQRHLQRAPGLGEWPLPGTQSREPASPPQLVRGIQGWWESGQIRDSKERYPQSGALDLWCHG